MKTYDLHLTNATLHMGEGAIKPLVQAVYNLAINGATHVYFGGERVPIEDAMAKLTSALSNTVDTPTDGE